MLYHVIPSLPSQKFSENPGSSACHAPLATASGSSAAPYFAAPTPWPPLNPPPQAAPSSWGWVQTSVESPWKLGGLIYHYTIYTPKILQIWSLPGALRMWSDQETVKSLIECIYFGDSRLPAAVLMLILWRACRNFPLSNSAEHFKQLVKEPPSGDLKIRKMSNGRHLSPPLPNWSIWCLKMLATPWYCHNLVGKMMLKTKK